MRYLFTESSPNFGGQEQQILLQMAELNRGSGSCLLACRDGSAIAVEAERRGLAWEPVPFRNSLDVGSILSLRGLILDQSIDVALCHSGHDANVLAIAARTVLRRPVLVRVRTYLAGKVRVRTVNRLVDRTVVPSEFLRREIVSDPCIRGERVSVLRPIVPFEDLQSQALTVLPEGVSSWLADRSPVLVQAAMLRSEKGHRTALAAVARLRARYPKLGYVAAGSGPKESDLRRLVEKLDLGENVLFAGLLMPVAPLLVRADLVLMPSRNEPLGLAQIEALALGVPVVVSNVGGLPETVVDGEGGWVVPAGDELAWAETISSAVADPAEAARRAVLGKARVREIFSADAYLSALQSVVRSCGQRG